MLQRIIETADEYHYIAEQQWSDAIETLPTDEESSFEFRRLLRAALQFYARAFLVLDMVETDAEQQLEELLEVVGELEPELEELFQKNDVTTVLDEESTAHLSQVFSVAEVIRSALLDRSNKLAASLRARFATGE